jgi:hypothetical protein
MINVLLAMHGSTFIRLTEQPQRAASGCGQHLRLNFFSYQQLLRIATQPTTQRPFRVDIKSIFAPKHSLRDGLRLILALSPVS